MALARVLVLLSLNILQEIFGAQFNLGNSYVEANKAIQQQPSMRNVPSIVIAKSNDKVVQKLNMDFNRPNSNQTFTTPNGSTTANVKFFKNQGYSVPPSSFTLINPSAQISQPLFATSIQADVNAKLPNDKTNTEQLNSWSDQMTKKQVTNVTGVISNTPLYITLGSQQTTGVSSPATYISNAQPTLSSLRFVPNVVQLLSAASPQNQPLHPTVASAPVQPTNGQNQANYRFLQSPAAAAPSQNTMNKTIQTRHSLNSLLLSHLLAQSCNSQNSSSLPINNCANQKSKPANINKNWLPILISLMSEKGKNGSEGGRLSHQNKASDRNLNDCIKVSHLETNTETRNHVDPVCENKSRRKLYYTTDEDDDYSDESSDYSTEDYDYD